VAIGKKGEGPGVGGGAKGGSSKESWKEQEAFTFPGCRGGRGGVKTFSKTVVCSTKTNEEKREI